MGFGPSSVIGASVVRGAVTAGQCRLLRVDRGGSHHAFYLLILPVPILVSHGTIRLSRTQTRLSGRAPCRCSGSCSDFTCSCQGMLIPARAKVYTCPSKDRYIIYLLVLGL